MRIALNELIVIVDAFVEQAKKLGDQTIQEEFEEHLRRCHLAKTLQKKAG